MSASENGERQAALCDRNPTAVLEVHDPELTGKRRCCVSARAAIASSIEAGGTDVRGSDRLEHLQLVCERFGVPGRLDRCGSGVPGSLQRIRVILGIGPFGGRRRSRSRPRRTGTIAAARA